MLSFALLLTVLFIISSFKIIFYWTCTICNARYEGNLYALLFSKCKHLKEKS